MKKLLVKDNKIREYVYKKEKTFFILKSIFKNDKISPLIRWNAFLEMSLSPSYKVRLNPRCAESINKKKFNKLTFFSRHAFLKSIRKGDINGMIKSSW